MIDDKKLDELISNIVDTFKFYGITIDRMTLHHKVPEFDISVTEKNLKYDLNKTLDFAYYTLRSLVYGENPRKNQEIILNYNLVHEVTAQ